MDTFLIPTVSHCYSFSLLAIFKFHNILNEEENPQYEDDRLQDFKIIFFKMEKNAYWTIIGIKSSTWYNL